MVEIPGYQYKHRRLVEEYAERHYTDPEVSLEDASVFYDLDVRTLRRSLAHCNTSWRRILRELRCQRAAQLLERTTIKIDYIARLAGYSSTSAFGKVFRERYSSTPSQYRRGKKGPARVGGPTGAFDHGRQHGWSDSGWGMVLNREYAEARERANDRHVLSGQPAVGHGLSGWKEVHLEREQPRRLREDAAHWRQLARERAKANGAAA